MEESLRRALRDVVGGLRRAGGRAGGQVGREGGREKWGRLKKKQKKKALINSPNIDYFGTRKRGGAIKIRKKKVCIFSAGTPSRRGGRSAAV